MRQIKFRAWDKRTNEMFTDGLVVSKEGILCCFNGENQCEIMQFTGLTDKNGIEIFEGDVLENIKEETVISVIWNTTGANWEFNEHNIKFDDGVGRGDWRLTIGVAKNCKVIGNVYESKHLIDNTDTKV